LFALVRSLALRSFVVIVVLLNFGNSTCTHIFFDGQAFCCGMSGQELFGADFSTCATRNLAKRSKNQRKKATAIANDIAEAHRRRLVAEGLSASTQVELTAALRKIGELEAEKSEWHCKFLSDRSNSERIIGALRYRLNATDRECAALESASQTRWRTEDSLQRAAERTQTQVLNSIELEQSRTITALQLKHGEYKCRIEAEHGAAYAKVKREALALAEEAAQLKATLDTCNEDLTRVRRERNESRAAYLRDKRIVRDGIEQRRRAIDLAVRQRAVLSNRSPSPSTPRTPGSYSDE
jgi:hypothetical protein